VSDDLITCACPNCGNTELNQIDTVIAVIKIAGFNEVDGDLEPEFHDGSNMLWDSSSPQQPEWPYHCPECKTDINGNTMIRVVSWKPEVQTAGNGDKWSSNALRFATKEEAEANAKNLMSRWLLVTATRAFPSSDPVNYRWEDNQPKGV